MYQILRTLEIRYEFTLSEYDSAHFEAEALATLIVNRFRGTFIVVGVKAPEFGACGKEILQDIAILMGGLAISADVSMFGQAKGVTVQKDNTVIVDGIEIATVLNLELHR